MAERVRGTGTIVLTLLFVQLASFHLTDAACDKPTDVIFLVDDSEATKILEDTEGETTYPSSIQDFLVGMGRKLLPSDTVRIGVTMFSQTPRRVTELTSNLAIFTTALDPSIPEFRSQNTDLGIADAQGQLSQGHPEAQKIVVLVTNGISTNHTKTTTTADAAALLGTRFLGVSFLGDVPLPELRLVTKDESLVYVVNNANELTNEKFQQDIINNICQVGPVSPAAQHSMSDLTQVHSWTTSDLSATTQSSTTTSASNLTSPASEVLDVTSATSAETEESESQTPALGGIGSVATSSQTSTTSASNMISPASEVSNVTSATSAETEESESQTPTSGDTGSVATSSQTSTTSASNLASPTNVVSDVTSTTSAETEESESQTPTSGDTGSVATSSQTSTTSASNLASSTNVASDVTLVTSAEIEESESQTQTSGDTGSVATSSQTSTTSASNMISPASEVSDVTSATSAETEESESQTQTSGDTGSVATSSQTSTTSASNLASPTHVASDVTSVTSAETEENESQTPTSGDTGSVATSSQTSTTSASNLASPINVVSDVTSTTSAETEESESQTPTSGDTGSVATSSQTSTTSVPTTPRSSSSVTGCPVTDLVILLDDSEATKTVEDDYVTYPTAVKEYLSDMVDQFTTSSDVLLSLSLVSSTARMLVSEHLSLGTAGVQGAIQDFIPEWRSLDTYTGIQKAVEWFDNSGRPEAKRVILLLTNGISSNATRTIQEAQTAISDKDVKIVTVSFMGMAPVPELSNVASNPSLVFTSPSAFDIHTTLDNVSTAVCSGPMPAVESPQETGSSRTTETHDGNNVTANRTSSTVTVSATFTDESFHHRHTAVN